MYFQITLKHLYITCIYSLALNPQHGAWEFARPVHVCFVDSLVSGPLIRALRFLCNQCQILAHIAGRLDSASDALCGPVWYSQRLDQRTDPIGQEALSNGRNLAWERFGILLEELDEVAWEKEAWASLLRLLPPRLVPR